MTLFFGLDDLLGYVSYLLNVSNRSAAVFLNDDRHYFGFRASYFEVLTESNKFSVKLLIIPYRISILDEEFPSEGEVVSFRTALIIFLAREWVPERVISLR